MNIDNGSENFEALMTDYLCKHVSGYTPSGYLNKDFPELGEINSGTAEGIEKTMTVFCAMVHVLQYSESGVCSSVDNYTEHMAQDLVENEDDPDLSKNMATSAQSFLESLLNN